MTRAGAPGGIRTPTRVGAKPLAGPYRANQRERLADRDESVPDQRRNAAA